MLSATRNSQILDIYNRHVDTVYRVCYSFMKNRTEAEDMVQETFLKLLTHPMEFESQRHERAWLIVTASNVCKDALRKWWRHPGRLTELDGAEGMTVTMENPVAEAILALPENAKTVVYLYYYEGYSTGEIAKHLRCPEATIRSRLARARKQLEKLLGGDTP